MTRQAGSDRTIPATDGAVTHHAVDDRLPCLFVAGSGAFQRKKIWTSLEESGNTVHRFTGPVALLSAMGSTPPDAILCEMAAAPEPVFELLSQLARLESDACVILIGPEIGAGQVARCLRDGAFDYLTVPALTPRVLDSPRSARMPRSEERGGMAARSEAEAHSLLVYKSPAWKGGVLYCRGGS